MPHRRAASPDARLSRTLSALLRHRASEAGLPLSPDGFALVSDLLALPCLRGATAADVERVACSDSKQRFLHEARPAADGGPRVRANYGHSLPCVDNAALLVRIGPSAARGVAACVHGTSRAAWAAIATEGLRRMGRNCVHFAPGPPGDRGVIAGARATAEVLVYVDVAAAVEGGVPFFRSANGVLLSPGVEYLGNAGVVPPSYFASVIDRSRGRELLREAAQDMPGRS